MSKKAQLRKIGEEAGLRIANNAKEETIAKKVAEKKGISVEELYASLEVDETTTEDTENTTNEPTVTTTADVGGGAENKPTAPVTGSPKLAKAKGKGLSGKTLRVIVHNNDPLSKDREYFVGHNGKPYRGLYEEEVTLPVELIKIFKDASTEVEEAILDEKGQPTGKTRTVEKKRFLIESVIEDL